MQNVDQTGRAGFRTELQQAAHAAGTAAELATSYPPCTLLPRLASQGLWRCVRHPAAGLLSMRVHKPWRALPSPAAPAGRSTARCCVRRRLLTTGRCSDGGRAPWPIAIPALPGQAPPTFSAHLPAGQHAGLPGTTATVGVSAGRRECRARSCTGVHRASSHSALYLLPPPLCSVSHLQLAEGSPHTAGAPSRTGREAGRALRRYAGSALTSGSESAHARAASRFGSGAPR